MFKVLLIVILLVVALVLLRTMFMRRDRSRDLFVTEATGRTTRPATAPATGRTTSLTKPGDGVDASPLEFEVIRLLEQQKKIQAIKVVRQHTGLGLKESKDLVEEVERTGRLRLPHMPATRYTIDDDELLDQARRLKLDGKAILAIKLIREHTGLGLKDAKDTYDTL
jgi:ribosomal protein L7/L12